MVLLVDGCLHIDLPRRRSSSGRLVIAVHGVSRTVAVRTSQSDCCPEQPPILSILWRWRHHEAEGGKHRGYDSYQKLEVAVQIRQVEIILVQLDSSHSFKTDGDDGKTAY